jgi:hypothetical protein
MFSSIEAETTFSFLTVSAYPTLIPLNKLAYFFVYGCFLFHLYIYIKFVGGLDMHTV